jgi:hypothetical protein
MTCWLHAKGHRDDGHRVAVALLTCNYILLPQTVSRRNPGLHASYAWDGQAPLSTGVGHRHPLSYEVHGGQ